MYAEQGDFVVDNRYTFEAGDKGKPVSQITDLKDAVVASDDITQSFHNKSVYGYLAFCIRIGALLNF